MKLSKKIRGDATVLTLNGEFDSFVCRPFLDEVGTVLDRPGVHVVLNMRKVRFINSTGIGSIIKSRRTVRENGGEMVVAEPSPFVKEALDSLGLGEVLRICGTEDEALSVLRIDDGLDLGGDDRILFQTQGTDLPPKVGRITRLEEDGLIFEAIGHDMEVEANSTLKLKFRLPLFKKSHYFEVTARVARTVHSSTGVSVSTVFLQMPQEDKRSIHQFLGDMQFLRNEARGRGEGLT